MVVTDAHNNEYADWKREFHYQADNSTLFVDGAEALDEVLVDFIGRDDFRRCWYTQLEHALVPIDIIKQVDIWQLKITDSYKKEYVL